MGPGHGTGPGRGTGPGPGPDRIPNTGKIILGPDQRTNIPEIYYENEAPNTEVPNTFIVSGSIEIMNNLLFYSFY